LATAEKSIGLIDNPTIQMWHDSETKKIFFIVVLFLCLPERKSTKKKGQPFTWSSILRDFPELLAKNGRRRKVAAFIPPCGVLRRVAFPFFAVLRGCVKWHY
jgi:hypothetical protein